MRILGNSILAGGGRVSKRVRDKKSRELKWSGYALNAGGL